MWGIASGIILIPWSWSNWTSVTKDCGLLNQIRHYLEGIYLNSHPVDKAVIPINKLLVQPFFPLFALVQIPSEVLHLFVKAFHEPRTPTHCSGQELDTAIQSLNSLNMSILQLSGFLSWMSRFRGWAS